MQSKGPYLVSALAKQKTMMNTLGRDLFLLCCPRKQKRIATFKSFCIPNSGHKKQGRTAQLQVMLENFLKTTCQPETECWGQMELRFLGWRLLPPPSRMHC